MTKVSALPGISLLHLPGFRGFPVGLQLLLDFGVLLPGPGEMQPALGVGLEVIIAVVSGGQHRIDGLHARAANRAVGETRVLVGVVLGIVLGVRQGDDVLLDALGVFHRDAGFQLREFVRMTESVQEDTGHGFPVFGGGGFALHHGRQDDYLIQSVLALLHLGQDFRRVHRLLEVIQHRVDDVVRVLVLCKVVGIREEVSLQAADALGSGHLLQEFVVKRMGFAGFEEFRLLADAGLLQDGPHFTHLNTLREGDTDVSRRFAHDFTDFEKTAAAGNLIRAGVPVAVSAFHFRHNPEKERALNQAFLLQLVGHDDGAVAGGYGDFAPIAIRGDAGCQDAEQQKQSCQRGDCYNCHFFSFTHSIKNITAVKKIKVKPLRYREKFTESSLTTALERTKMCSVLRVARYTF